MTEGRLYYNSDNQRYGLMNRGKWEIEGFHWGMVLEIWLDGQWQPTRIEYGEDWYLVGFPGLVLYDLKARVEL